MNQVVRAIFVVSIVSVSACGSAPPPPLPAAEEAALRSDQRGREAFRRGDMKEALASYDDALRLYSSIENGQGAATELLNIATVQYQLGQRALALQALDQLLTARSATTPEALKAEAAYRRAVFDFDAGDSANAAQWLERAQGLCPAGNCELAGRMLNLKARMVLARKQLDAAENDAKRALELNRRRNDPIEEANSLRILADIAAHRGQHAQAVTAYEQALALDKQAAAPGKIALDLLGAGRSLAAAGKTKEAAEYAERALRVAESIGDERGQQEAKALLNSRSR